jgi:hypothetical protein
MAAPPDKIPERRKLIESDRSSSMNSSGGDANLSTESERASVTKLGRRIPHANRTTQPSQKMFGYYRVIGYNGICTLTAMSLDVPQSRFHIRYNLNSQYCIMPFCIKISFSCRP